MNIQKYSIKKQGNVNITPHFKVREFACTGSDITYVDIDGVEKLEKMRVKLNKPININSSYRTSTHNKDVGGSPNSNHLKGAAFDIGVVGVSPEEVCKLAESFGFTEIGCYLNSTNGTFSHVATSSNKYFYYKRGGVVSPTNTFGGSYIISEDGYFSTITYKAMQRFLKVNEDGDFKSISMTALQTLLGVPITKVWDKVTILALQKRMNTLQDGYFSKPSSCIREMQKRLNKTGGF